MSSDRNAYEEVMKKMEMMNEEHKRLLQQMEEVKTQMQMSLTTLNNSVQVQQILEERREQDELCVQKTLEIMRQAPLQRVRFNIGGMYISIAMQTLQNTPQFLLTQIAHSEEIQPQYDGIYYIDRNPSMVPSVLQLLHGNLKQAIHHKDHSYDELMKEFRVYGLDEQCRTLIEQSSAAGVFCEMKCSDSYYQNRMNGINYSRETLLTDTPVTGLALYANLSFAEFTFSSVVIVRKITVCALDISLDGYWGAFYLNGATMYCRMSESEAWERVVGIENTVDGQQSVFEIRPTAARFWKIGRSTYLGLSKLIFE